MVNVKMTHMYTRNLTVCVCSLYKLTYSNHVYMVEKIKAGHWVRHVLFVLNI